MSKTKTKIFHTILLSTLFLAPFYARAEIIITEIMYNPEGTDSGREWIEVYNGGTTSIDLSTYKLLENGTNHRLSIYNSDDLFLEPDKYAIIADNPTNFLVDFSQTGLLIDSAFSLNNTGEEISLIDSGSQAIDIISYLPEWGANGTGNSLQLNGNDWIPADPTPFQTNKTEVEDESADSNSNSSSSTDASTGSSKSDSTSTHSSMEDVSDYKPKIELKISAGRKRYTIINSPIEFYIQHNQDSDRKISAKWSMGDGTLRRGPKITHTYTAVGTYNIVLNAKNKDEMATTRTKVYVKEPQIDLNFSIRGKTVDISLINKTKNEVNLGGFQLKFASQKFEIAEDTILDAGETLILSGKITNFEFSTPQEDKDPSNQTNLPGSTSENTSSNQPQKPKITLYYPNGEKLDQKELFPNINDEDYQKIYPILDPETIHKLDLDLENSDQI